jgi:hypothetical protein
VAFRVGFWGFSCCTGGRQSQRHVPFAPNLHQIQCFAGRALRTAAAPPRVVVGAARHHSWESQRAPPACSSPGISMPRRGETPTTSAEPAAATEREAVGRGRERAAGEGGSCWRLAPDAGRSVRFCSAPDRGRGQWWPPRRVRGAPSSGRS